MSNATTAIPWWAITSGESHYARGGAAKVLWFQLALFCLLFVLSIAGACFLRLKPPRMRDIGRKWIVVACIIAVELVVVVSSAFELAGTFTTEVKDNSFAHRARVVGTGLVATTVVYVISEALQIFGGGCKLLLFIAVAQQIILYGIEIMWGGMLWFMMTLATILWVGIVVIILWCYPMADKKHAALAAREQKISADAHVRECLLCPNACWYRWLMFRLFLVYTPLWTYYMLVAWFSAGIPTNDSTDIVCTVMYLVLYLFWLLQLGVEFIMMEEASSVANHNIACLLKQISSLQSA